MPLGTKTIYPYTYCTNIMKNMSEYVSLVLKKKIMKLHLVRYDNNNNLSTSRLDWWIKQVEPARNHLKIILTYLYIKCKWKIKTTTYIHSHIYTYTIAPVDQLTHIENKTNACTIPSYFSCYIIWLTSMTTIYLRRNANVCLNVVYIYNMCICGAVDTVQYSRSHSQNMCICRVVYISFIIVYCTSMHL